MLQGAFVWQTRRSQYCFLSSGHSIFHPYLQTKLRITPTPSSVGPKEPPKLLTTPESLAVESTAWNDFEQYIYRVTMAGFGIATLSDRRYTKDCGGRFGPRTFPGSRTFANGYASCQSRECVWLSGIAARKLDGRSIVIMTRTLESYPCVCAIDPASPIQDKCNVHGGTSFPNCAVLSLIHDKSLNQENLDGYRKVPRPTYTFNPRRPNAHSASKISSLLPSPKLFLTHAKPQIQFSKDTTSSSRQQKGTRNRKGIIKAACSASSPFNLTDSVMASTRSYSTRAGVSTQAARKEQLRSYATILESIRDATPEDRDRTLKDFRARKTLDEAIEIVQRKCMPDRSEVPAKLNG
ncbi:hypothetical protein KCU89_g146, partial [Aureobasidium melanogenum]